MLSTFGLEHYFNFRVLGSGHLPNIPGHLLIYFNTKSGGHPAACNRALSGFESTSVAGIGRDRALSELYTERAGEKSTADYWTFPNRSSEVVETDVSILNPDSSQVPPLSLQKAQPFTEHCTTVASGPHRLRSKCSSDAGPYQVQATSATDRQTQ